MVTPGTIEFIWCLLLLGSVVGLYFARQGRLGRPSHEAARPAGWLNRLCARLTRLSAAELRWWLTIALLLILTYIHYRQNGIHRIVLNLLLFFEWHPFFTGLLLALSVVAFLYAWRGELTWGRVVGAAGLAGVVWLFARWDWSCLMIILTGLTLVGVLWAWRDHLGWWMWVGLWSIAFLATALFLSHAMFTLQDVPLKVTDVLEVFIALVLTFGIYVWAWYRGATYGWTRERRFVFRTSAFVGVLLFGGLVWGVLDYNQLIPDWRMLEKVDDFGDYAILILAVIMVLVVYSLVRAAHVQPIGWASAVLIVFLGGGLILVNNLYGKPEDFMKIEDQFKYGSIGSDHFLSRGVPALLWEILPERFNPQQILKHEIQPYTDKTGAEQYQPRFGISGWEAFGVWKEVGRRVRVDGRPADTEVDRPIGFSKRRVFGLDFIGMNCALCHVSQLRTKDHPEPRLIGLMPANTVDIELYFSYFLGTAEQADFAKGTMWYDIQHLPLWIISPLFREEPRGLERPRIMQAIIKKHPELRLGQQLLDCGLWGVCQEIRNAYQRMMYRVVLVSLAKSYLKKLKKSFSFIDPRDPNHHPRFGPGRADSWSPAKRTLFIPPLDVAPPGGTVDYSSIWNQKLRSGLRFHWDGNTDLIQERNIIAGLVVNGAQIELLDVRRVSRITDWIDWRPAPRFDDYFPLATRNIYKDKTPKERMAIHKRGKRLFQQWCASCHALDGDRVGRVEPLDSRELNTDSAKLDSFTKELQDAFNRFTRRTPYLDPIKDHDEGQEDDPSTERAWKLRRFRMQDGYMNMPLDGVWARAPYLHNGSVPSLRALLSKQPCEKARRKRDSKDDCRPRIFYRGNEHYDEANVGFTSDSDTEADETVEPSDFISVFDTRKHRSALGYVYAKVLGEHSGPDRYSKNAPLAHVVLYGRDLRLDRSWSTAKDQVADLVRAVAIEKYTKQLKLEQKISDEAAAQAARKTIEQEFSQNELEITLHKPHYFKFDTTQAGNSNWGHLYGTDLLDSEKEDLVEFLKTL